MESSDRAVYSALAGNILIAGIKSLAALSSGSSAMLAEALHSLIDTCDSLLLLMGRRRSRRPADATHPFGYGQELYFWSFVVSLMIFTAGGGFSMYEGIRKILHPAELHGWKWSFAVLGLAGIVEGASLWTAWRQFRRENPQHGFWKTVRISKDPSTFTVVFEDSAGLLGVAIAFAGLLAAARFQEPVFDGIGSMVIGGVLLAVAVLIARESKGLLLGEAMERDAVEQIRRMAEEDAAVERVNRPLTMHFGPDTILLAMEIQFQRGLNAGDIAAAVDRIEGAIRRRFPRIRHIFLEAESIAAPARS